MGYAWLDYSSLSPGSVVGAGLGEKVNSISASDRACVKSRNVAECARTAGWRWSKHSLACSAAHHLPTSLTCVLVQKLNYGDALRFGKVRTSPVSEAFGARYDFRKFVADESRMWDVIAGQYQDGHTESRAEPVIRVMGRNFQPVLPSHEASGPRPG